ncbi:hypothetical protein BAE44_0012591 [Dichanthelium oligosanthes]|uniref:Uncharacterized protein n=1 Tax=Dichanthelium oligosanthes TaxID=888268 RepID=A0A1E5VMM9_9POAL|nr:hypothetical protein BAE44_0012591 [Dichanthelium oligosanthes]
MAAPWVILDTAPLVCSANELAPRGRPFRGDGSAPACLPGAGRRRQAQLAFCARRRPLGLLFLQTPPRRSSSPAPRRRAGPGIMVDVPSRPRPVYYVCDAAKGTAFRLPDPEQPGIICPGNVGLVAAPGSDTVGATWSPSSST